MMSTKMKRSIILRGTSLGFAFSVLVAAGAAWAQTTPLETYTYGQGTATAPYGSSLKVLAVPSASANSLVTIPGNVLTTLNDTQTLTNKTLTSPVIAGAALSGTLSGSPVFSGIPQFTGLSSGSCANALGLDSSNNVVLFACGGGGGSGFPITLGSTSIAASSTTTTIAGLTLTSPTINGGTISSGGAWTVTAGTPTVYIGLDASNHMVTGTPAGGGNMTGSGATTTGNLLQSNNTGATLDSATDTGVPATNVITTTNTKTLTNKTYSGGTFDTANAWTVTAGSPTTFLGIDASNHLVSGTPAGSGNMTGSGATTTGNVLLSNNTGATLDSASDSGIPGANLITTTNTKTLTNKTYSGGTFDTVNTWTVTAGTPTVFLGIDASNHLVSGSAAGGGNVSTAGTLTANTLIIGAGTTNINNEADWSVVSHELIGNLSGSAAPAAPGSTDGIQIVAASGRAGVVTADSFANGSGFIGRRANGTPASPTTVLAGQAVAAVQGGGYDGTAYFTTGGEIAIASDENWSNTAHGSRIDIYRTGNTTTTLVKSASFDSSGGFQMANSSGTLPGSPGAGGIAVPTTAGFFIGTVQAGSQIAGTSVALSTNQWAACVGTTVTTASQTFTLPAASGLSTNGCFDIQAQAATTLALAGGTDTINGGTAGASLSIPAGTTVHVTLTGTNFTAPLGSASSGVASVNTSTPGVTIGGTGSGPYTGAVTVDLYAASNTQSGNTAYGISSTTDYGKTVYRTNTTTQTDTLPDTGTITIAGHGPGLDYCTDGTGNTLARTTSSTINGQVSLFVPPYTCLAIQATATNVWIAARSSPRVAPLADITATGNVDMAQACFIPLNYNSASAGTLTFPDVAGFAGCITSISESSTGQATVAAAGSATVVANTTACTTNKRTAGQYATITVQVLGDSAGHPIYKVAGECG